MKRSLLAASEKATHLYSIPPEGFDPLQACEEELAKYGLPSRPPEAAEPDAFAFWLRMLSKPLRIIQPTFAPILPPLPALASLAPSATPQPSSRPRFTSRARIENSRNWCGAYLQATPGSRFSEISGTWRVPAPRLPRVEPLGPEQNVPFRDEYRSSAWLGFDGHRSYPGVAMPQCGTHQFVKRDGRLLKTSVGAWWQWWRYDQVTPVNEISNLQVDVGDEVSVQLTAVAHDEVHFVMKNLTTGVLVAFLVQAPPKSRPIGLTAEWVVERPSWPGSIWPHKLPRLTETFFSNCYARSGSTPFGSQTLHRLERARLIHLQQRFAAPYRSAHSLISERNSATSLRVSFAEAIGS